MSFSPGLKDVVAAETRLSHVDGEAGILVIGGYPLEEIAERATYEEMIHLLWHRKLPTAGALDGFAGELAASRPLPGVTFDLLRGAAKEKRPVIDAVRMAVASLPSIDDTADARSLVAGLPTIVAAYWRLLHGNEPVEPEAGLGHVANLLYMLDGEIPGDDRVQALTTYLNTVIDHGMNASTFTARVIVSTRSDFVSAVTGAIGALKGPLHGGAPGPVISMLEAIGDADNAEPFLREKLESGERLMGFGHAVYRVRDPRADVLSRAAQTFFDRTTTARTTTARMATATCTPWPFTSRKSPSNSSKHTSPAGACRPTSSSTPPFSSKGWVSTRTSSPPCSPWDASLAGPHTASSNEP